MESAYVGICLMCGRTMGHIVHGRFVTPLGGARPTRQAQHVRCGYCRGSVFFEPDTAPDPPDWIALMRHKLAASG